MTRAAPELRWLEVPGGRLWLATAGVGPPLVMLHGWAMDHRVFRPQMAGLADDLRTIAYDRRGFGRSEAMPDPRRELDDLHTVATGVIGGPFHLLGLSQGGRVALRYAAARPGWVRSLILQGAAVDGLSPPGPANETIPLEEYARLARAGNLDELRRRWLEHPMMRLGTGGHADARRLLKDMVDDYRAADLLESSWRDYRPDADPVRAVAALAIPVLLLTGARETRSRRETARLLRARLPLAEERVLPAGGHLCNLTEPDAYNAAVLAFCRRVDAGPAD